MNDFVENKLYIGDLSHNDARVLKQYALLSKSILEAGMGASTQIMTYYTAGHVTSIETEDLWIEKTATRLQEFNIDPAKYNLYPWDQLYKTIATKQYDFIFDDCVDSKRREFGIIAWNFLKPGGYLALHDQRRRPDWDTTAHIISHYWESVGTVYYNTMDSNITIIEKRFKPAIWENWQITENIDMEKW